MFSNCPRYCIFEYSSSVTQLHLVSAAQLHASQVHRWAFQSVHQQCQAVSEAGFALPQHGREEGRPTVISWKTSQFRELGRPFRCLILGRLAQQPPMGSGLVLQVDVATHTSCRH